jgi:hypothetical protein
MMLSFPALCALWQIESISCNTVRRAGRGQVCTKLSNVASSGDSNASLFTSSKRKIQGKYRPL